MRTIRWLSLIGLTALLLGTGWAQAPTLVLTNGDANADNRIDDADLLEILQGFGMASADLNGDAITDDADLLLVLSNFGAEGAPAFRGRTATPAGAFSATLRVQLGDWGGTAQTVKVQLKPVGSEDDPNVPIFEYTVSVGGASQDVSLTNLPAGVYTVRAFPETPGRWLRAAGILMTGVPWIFAVPTGTNKVTVYWDPVPGATGYRVRWGGQQGVHPNASPVLPAGARRFTVEGLVSEQEYYFVVKAIYNEIVGKPSKEDSATPHVGAIPWDTNDPNLILPAIRLQMESPHGRLVALSPEGLLFIEDDPYGTNRRVVPAYFFYDPATGEVRSAEGGVVQPSQRTELDTDSGTGSYRRVTTSADSGCIGAVVTFYVPPVSYGISRYIRVPEQTNATTRDTPHVYLGMRYGSIDIEGGIAFHPAGRGVRGAENQAPNYNRWQPYLKVVQLGRTTLYPVAYEDIYNPSGHIRYDQAPYGLVVRLRLVLLRRSKGVELKVKVWSAVLDDVAGSAPRLLYDFYGCADVDGPSSGAVVRRVVSIAQLRDHTGSNGYRRTGSYFRRVGVGYQPLFDVGDLWTSAEVYCPSLHPFWMLWTPDVSAPPTTFPPAGGVVIVDQRSPYYREIVDIKLVGKQQCKTRYLS